MPADIAKAISRISLDKLEQARAETDRLESELTYWRGRYRRETDPERRQLIKQRGEAVSSYLQTVPQFPPLRALAQHDELSARDEIALLIIWLLEQLNISNTLSEAQIESISALILEEFGWLRLEDLAIVMRSAIKGEYGLIYNRLDGAIILDWLRRYAEALMERRHLEKVEAHMRSKERNDATRYHDSAKMSEALRFLYNNQKEAE